MRLRGTLRTFALGLLVATVVTWGGCLAYLAGVRTEVRELRSGLEAQGAPLDLEAFVGRLEQVPDPRVAELLRECEAPPIAAPEVLAERLVGLGILDPAAQLDRFASAADAESEGRPPVRGYMTLVNRMADEVRDRLDAGDPAGAARALPPVLAAIDLVEPASLVLGMARTGLELHVLWLVSDVLLALPPDAALPAELEPWVRRLEPRGRLRLVLEGERAFGLEHITDLRRAAEVDLLPGVGELQALLLEREYLIQMERSLGLLEAPWVEAEDLQREIEARARGTSRFDLRLVAAALLPRVVDALRAANDAEALRDLALAGLAARRGGVEAARAELEGRLDPFSRAPYALEVGEDGALRLWSAGADGALAGPPGWTRALEPSADDLRWIVPGP